MWLPFIIWRVPFTALPQSLAYLWPLACATSCVFVWKDCWIPTCCITRRAPLPFFPSPSPVSALWIRDALVLRHRQNVHWVCHSWGKSCFIPLEPPRFSLMLLIFFLFLGWGYFALKHMFDWGKGGLFVFHQPFFLPDSPSLTGNLGWCSAHG